MSTLEAEGTNETTAEEPAKNCCICGSDLSRGERRKDSAGRYWCKHCTDLADRPKPLAIKEVCADCGAVMALLQDGQDRICTDCQTIRANEQARV